MRRLRRRNGLGGDEVDVGGLVMESGLFCRLASLCWVLGLENPG
jgi:hypothetical protein